ncbi:MAG: hypothetical protein M9901_12725 [Lentimicrobium sp.]|nr:hypothetical protein [Lentimicrobium sp.]
MDFGFTLGELRYAPVRICFDLVADYAEQGTLKELIKDASIHLTGFTLT